MAHDHDHHGHAGHDHSGHDHSHHDHDGHDHGRSDGPGPSHGGHHHHAPRDFTWAFAIGAGLNLAFVVGEASAGFMSDSLALLADAGHNLSDVLGLLLAWGAVALAKSLPTQRRTYGMGKSTILASLANAILLLVAVGAIAWEAIRRLGSPEPVVTTTVMIVAAIGIVINGGTALMFMRGSHGDMNVRGAFLHLAADAGISAGVVVAAIVMSFTGWLWLDPAVSLAVAAMIVWGAWDLLRGALNLAMDAVPDHIDTGAVRRWLEALPGVDEIHDLHIWAMSTTESALTAHIVRAANDDCDAFLTTAEAGLATRFGIGHATLQIETSRDCPRAAVDAV